MLYFFKDYFSTDLCSVFVFFFPSYSSFKILVNSIHNKNPLCKQVFTPKMMGCNQRVTETVIRDCCTYIAISPKPHRTYLVLEAQHILGHLFIFSWVSFYKFIYTTYKIHKRKQKTICDNKICPKYDSKNINHKEKIR